MGTGGEAGVEDRLVETRIAGVDDDVGLRRLDEGDEVGFAAGIHRGGDEPPGVIELGDRPLGRLDGDVCECEGREERTSFCDRGHRRSHAACAYHQDVHEYPIWERPPWGRGHSLPYRITRWVAVTLW